MEVKSEESICLVVIKQLYIWIFTLHLEFTPGGLSAPRGRRAEGRLRGFQPWCSIRAADA